MQAHLISAIMTFVSTFLTTFGTLILTVDPTHLDKSALFALLISAVNVALRAAFKVVADK